MQKAVTTPSRQPRRCRHRVGHLAFHLLDLEVERTVGFPSLDISITELPFGCHSDRRVMDGEPSFRQLVIWDRETFV